MTWTFDPPHYPCHLHPDVDLTSQVVAKAIAEATVVVGAGVAEEVHKVAPGPFVVTVQCPGAGAKPTPHDEPCAGAFGTARATGGGRRGLPEGWTPEMVEMYEEAAKDLQPPKVLARIVEHNKFVISTVSTVGTLLAGLGGVTAAVAVTRTTYQWHDIPLVPVGALATSVLAALAVVVALFARRPRFEAFNTQNDILVKDYFDHEIARNRRTLKVSWFFFLSAAVAAAVTALVAGVLVLAQPADPRNLAALTATVGDKGAVTVALGGTVDGLDDDQVVRVAVVSDAQSEPVLTTIVYPDKDGVATLAGSASAPVGGTSMTAYVEVSVSDARVVDSYELVVDHPKVPAPAAEPAEEDKGNKDDKGDDKKN